jgi:hypothetical protein
LSALLGDTFKIEGNFLKKCVFSQNSAATDKPEYDVSFLLKNE